VRAVSSASDDVDAQAAHSLEREGEAGGEGSGRDIPSSTEPEEQVVLRHALAAVRGLPALDEVGLDDLRNTQTSMNVVSTISALREGKEGRDAPRSCPREC